MGINKKFQAVIDSFPVTKSIKKELILRINELVDDLKGSGGDDPTECELKHVYAITDSDDLVEIQSSDYHGMKAYYSNYNTIIGCDDDELPIINDGFSKNVIFVINESVALFKSLKEFETISSDEGTIVRNYTQTTAKEELVHTYWNIFKDFK